MNMIALVDQNWAIGKDGEQIVYLPSDLKFFRETTMGHPVILGRKTLATFPGGRPLKGRRNLILSRNPGFSAEGGEVFASLDALLAAAPEDSFVIGGASVYEALLDFWSRFDPYSMNTLLVSGDMMLAMLKLPEFQNPLTGG